MGFLRQVFGRGATGQPQRGAARPWEGRAGEGPSAQLACFPRGLLGLIKEVRW